MSNASSHEIEITPRMLDAGAEELAGFSTRFESLEDGADRIFKAMICVAPEKVRVAFEAAIMEIKTSRPD